MLQRPLFTFLFFCLLLGCVAAPATEVRRAEPVVVLPESRRNEDPSGVNEASRFVAGLTVTEPGRLADWTKTREWIAYSSAINRKWERFKTARLGKIRPWAKSHLSDFNPTTVFYPFSGPDLVYVREFFPNASTYILCGLEPVGNLPSPQTLQPLNASLGWMEISMRTLMDAGYFVTKEMRVTLKQSPLQGTVPIFCFMLARNGDRILSARTSGDHAEIRFLVPGDSRVRTLHYFSSDLSNGGMRKGSALLQLLRSSRPDVAYLKSASYLLHESQFSNIRDLLLTQCRTIVQDDSGIPLRFFAPDRWRRFNFGRYVAPLDIFKKYDQPDLATFYAEHPTSPLPFGAGYHWDPKSANLMVFTATGGR